jgi:hypothetical protein
MRFLALLPLLASMCAPAAQQEAQPSAQPSATSAAVTIRTELVDALEVLHGWDARRARAWAESDPDALRALYVRGSGAAGADLRLLRAYRARGLVVRRLVTQVFAVRVLRSDGSTLRLRVFDRVAGGDVLEHGHVVPLRSSRPVTRTITFRLDNGSWQVGAVTGSASGWATTPHAGWPRRPGR